MTRNRDLSDVSPLEPVLGRTSSRAESLQSSHDHDFSGTSHLPPVHVTRTRSRRSSSVIRPINQILGITEEHEEEDEEEEEEDQEEGKKMKMKRKNYEQDVRHGVIPEDSETGNMHQSDDDHKSQSASPDETTPYRQVSERSDSLYTLPNEGADLDRRKSRASKAESKKQVRFQDKVVKVSMMFAWVYIMILVAFLGILSIYWGSLFNRMSYVRTLDYLVVIDDVQVGDLSPLIGDTFTAVLNTTGRSIGQFHVRSGDDFETSGDRTPLEEVVQQIHHQKYWGGLYIPKNATLDYFNALQTNDSSFNKTLVSFVYETGRDPQNVPGTILSVIYQLEKSFVLAGDTNITSPLLARLSDEQKLNVAVQSPNILTAFWFDYTDNRPMSVPLLIGPTQLGLIYVLVMSFHQFNFASQMHFLIREKLRLRQYMVYHIITSQGAYLVMSLVYTLMTVAFQVPPTRTFGKAGFFVAWSVLFLTMSALGGVNENVAIQIFARNRAYIGFWIVFFLVTNLSPVLSPIAMMNQFYRYGYAMPMYNGHELLKVIFMDTYKGYMGRNIGILIAWIVLANILLPFNLRATKRYTKRAEERAKKALENQSK
jgi:hypothetical protein